MAEKKVARHRLAANPSTPLTVALEKISNAATGKRILALTGASAALAAVAATVPADVHNGASVVDSVNTSEVAKTVMAGVSVNAPVVGEKVSFGDVAGVSVKVKDETPVATGWSAPSLANVDLSKLPPAKSEVLAIAYKYIGTPYVFGGSHPGAFDCSGFVKYVYGKLGKRLPHSARLIGYAGHRIPLSAMQPGDIAWRPGHVGIYVGNGKVIQAFRPGKPLGVAPIQWGRFQAGVRL